MSDHGRDRYDRYPPAQGAYPSPLAQPLRPDAPGVAPAPGATAGIPTVRVRRIGAAAIWGLAVLAVLLAVLVAYFLAALGVGASIAGMVLALVPLTVVLLALRAVDRWEPEPRLLVVLAVAWGAIGAVAIALGVDLVLRLAFGPGDSAAADALGAVVQAPVVEELAKGLGVLLILLAGRRAFDGPVDGIVYGGLIGAGFAFTENIQYFGIALIEGGATQTTVTFFLRGILSPFAHVMFTAVTGFAVGLAVRRGRAVAGPWFAGVVGAMALHALWNGSSVLGDFFALYLVLQVPLFILFVVGVIALRAEEARLTRERLGEFAAAGWFTAEEVRLLATGSGRRAALAWAGRLRPDRRPQMRAFIREATALAASRQRVLTGRDPGAAAEQQALLARTQAARRALFAA
ncbi:PrsW family intramembrane metalloprotease [Microbacterium sp. SORGH_AS_0888]|uniref:PrsW family intramembrane metalloprotease n=1 Tax=Microbacterium sp. SORGH_AS_0888 TaxID=3041791 RepID=UPI0027897331|nr:PrsW family intramembrane metalloprotease [Microbacterium sp. SORGH_AS_0888]MDQ1129131.1 RsiW-degrading membrane proteinase PrsW (M82 family) [Microbacterium sp. SORGH_AS_0888]